MGCVHQVIYVVSSPFCLFTRNIIGMITGLNYVQKYFQTITRNGVNITTYQVNSYGLVFQVKPSGEDTVLNPDHMIHNQNVNIPPASHLISDLKPFTQYDARVACRSSQGVSDWTPWLTISTSEGGRSSQTQLLLHQYYRYIIMSLICPKIGVTITGGNGVLKSILSRVNSRWTFAELPNYCSLCCNLKLSEPATVSCITELTQ